ncbi:hypothetical protein BJX99DRAFT_255955 [Aspergillus californicus]
MPELSYPTVKTVDSLPKLLNFLTELHDSKQTLPPQTCFDVKGRNLGNSVSCSTLSLYLTDNLLYIIDLQKLSDGAFSTMSRYGTSLKTFLESPDITKVVFDVRWASHALYSGFQIKLHGVQDIQLMESGARRGDKTDLLQLGDLVVENRRLTAVARLQWPRAKMEGLRRFCRAMSGAHTDLDVRPITDATKDYCVTDLVGLPGLYKRYRGSLNHWWWNKVNEATSERIEATQILGPTPWQAEDLTRGPF